MIVLKIDTDSYHLIESTETFDNEIVYFTQDSKCIPFINCRLLTEHQFKVDYLLKLQTNKKISKREQKLAKNVFNKNKPIEKLPTNSFFYTKKIVDWCLSFFQKKTKKRNNEYQKLVSNFLVDDFFSKIPEEEIIEIITKTYSS